MQFGCCMGLSSFIHLSLQEGIMDKPLLIQDQLDRIDEIMKAAEENGFDFIEGEIALLSPEEKDSKNFLAFKQKMRSYLIKPEVFSAFIPPWIKVVGPSVEREKIKSYLSRAMPRAAEVGGKVIIWGSGNSRSFPKNYILSDALEQIEDFLIMTADFAQECGICIGIEPLNQQQSNTINSLREALALARKINRKEIKVMVDNYHFTIENEQFASIIDASKELVHVHVSNCQRLIPREGDFAVKSLLEMLFAMKYNLRLSLECNFDNYKKETKLGLDYLKTLWNKISKLQ